VCRSLAEDAIRLERRRDAKRLHPGAYVIGVEEKIQTDQIEIHISILAGTR
jgi:hypothetical protein